jgi:hypothetical protein
MVKAVDWHANEGHGLTPVVDDDADVKDWALWLLADVTGYQSEELDAVTVTVADDAITIGAPAGKLGDDVLAAVWRHILL